MREAFRPFTMPIAIAAIGAIVLGLGATSAQAAVPEDGLAAEYLFDAASGATVPYSVEGSPFGPATVRNVQASDWTGTSLTLRGGAKTSTGNWVELPDGLLSGRQSATVVAEVKASAAMLNTFHFLWNIGNESSATEYFFASLNCGSGRSPLIGIKSAGVEQLVQSGSCGVTANRGARRWAADQRAVTSETMARKRLSFSCIALVTHTMTYRALSRASSGTSASWLPVAPVYVPTSVASSMDRLAET